MAILKPSVSQQVIQHMHDNIANDTWRVGDKIPSEHMLTRELGVSRASVRLAIQQFIALGVLSSRHGKGTYVLSNNLDALKSNGNSITMKECVDVAKVLEFRLLIEPEACFLATKHGDDALFQRLRAHLNAMVANIGNSEEFIRQDILYHEEIGQASGNPLLNKCLRDIFTQTAPNHQAINKIFGYKDGIYYHSLILKAMEGRDAKHARKLMTEHLQQALDQLTD